MTRPDISVVIPCYNAERWIGYAVASALQQTRISVEVIVVNDGSTDSTEFILAQFGRNIRVIEQENQGVSSARNSGAVSARGTYIKFLDADDLIPKDSLHDAFRIAEANRDSVIIGWYEEIDRAGNQVPALQYSYPRWADNTGQLDPCALLVQATQSSLFLFPKRIFQNDGLRFGSGISFGEEYDFCRSVISLGYPIHMMERVISTIRTHDGTRLSGLISEEKHLGQLDAMKRNAATIATLDSENKSKAVEMLAASAWVRGRDCVRVGLSQVADQYFGFARSILGNRAAVGHPLYKALVHAIGPYDAERCLVWIKRAVL